MNKLIRRVYFISFLSLLCTVAITALAAEIEFFSPSGEVKNIRQVAARFTQQMVAFGNPVDITPFDIDCPATGVGRWADPHNWIYDFDRDLPAGISCQFKLKKGLTAISGQTLQAGETFRFNTGGPSVIESEPREGSRYIDEKQIFILGLDAPATADSIRKNAACLVDGIPERIPVKLISGKQRTEILKQRRHFLTSYYQAIFKRGADSDQPIIPGPFILGIDEKGSEREKFLKLRDSANSPIVVLQCQHTLPNESDVSLSWGKGITSVSGIATSAPQSLTFKTRPVFTSRFSCSRINKDAGCIPVLPAQLAFSAPVKVRDAEQIKLVADNKSFSPVISKQDRKNEFVQWLNFPVPLPEKTTFKLVLPPHLKDDAGRTPANAASFPLTVQTDENPPIAKFAAHFGILELNASKDTPPLLPVTLRNVEPNLATMLSIPAHDKPIGVHVLHADAGMDAVLWLRRLEQIDETSYHFDPATRITNMEGGSGLKSIFGAGDEYTSLELTKPLESKEFEVVGIPLQKPGFYMVELASPKLGAALLGEKRPYYVHAAALVTNLSVHFKQGRESSLVWVTRLDRGLPVVNASVEVRDCSGKIYQSGKTDADGILKIETSLPETDSLPPCLNKYDRQYFVSARSGNDFSFVFSDWNEGIALWRFNAYQNQWNGPDIVHAVMDRTLLRAGETVHMKLITRRKTRAGFAGTETPLPDTITIEHQGGEDRYQIPLSWDAQGVAVLDWKIPEQAKQGSYAIQVPSQKYGDRTAGDFRVESFRIPLMKALVQGPSAPLVHASSAAIGLQVNYLSGGGAANLPVKLRAQLQTKTVTFADYEDYLFANGKLKPGPENVGSASWYAGEYELIEPDDDTSITQDNNAGQTQLLSTQSLQLNAAGSAQAILTGLPASRTPQTLLTELEYRDPNGQIQTTASRTPRWPSAILVGIKPESWMSGADSLKFHVAVLDLQGKPVQNNKVSVTALQRETFSHRRRMLGGFYSYENRRELTLLGELCSGTTDHSGLLICEVKSPATGNIILQATAQDADGNESAANTEVWVSGDKDNWFDASDNDRIDLLPERKHYEPGETARFQIRMPFSSATALITVEREGIIDSFVTPVTRDNPVIEVPIKNNYAPNVFVSALLVRGRVNDVQPTAMVDLGKPAFKMGLAEIRVGWVAHELKVKVETDKPVYKVREQAKVSITVRRADGSLPPPGAEIALAAVDEGLLELRPNDSWSLLEAMMTRRGIEVATSTAQMQVIGKRHFGRKAMPAGGGGGRKSVRELFDTLLFWQARVKLDSNGHTDVVIPLNDALTSFRIVAVASGGMALFGTGSASVQSTQELMLLSGLPQVVREQDRFHAGFTIRNASDKAVATTIKASLNDGSGKPVYLDPLDVSLAAGEAREIGWDITVPFGSTGLAWDVIARAHGANEDGDHIKPVQKVIPSIPVSTYQATILQLNKGKSIAIKRPEAALPGRGGVKVGFLKSLSGDLSGIQEFMSRYPYSCFEQKASKAIALQDEKSWNSLMNTLPSSLDQDGLVKYFSFMTEGDDTLTAYLLAIADEAGYKLPEEAATRMKDGLTRFVEGHLIRYSALPTADLSIRKLAAIAALSRYGDVRPGWLDSIAIEPNLWPTSALLDWAFILKRTPKLDKTRTREAQQILRSRLNFRGSRMGFSTERSDALWWLMINGDVNANRMLLTILDTENWGADIPRLVHGMLDRQQNGHWNTTVANAWGVLALKKYAEKYESTPVTGSSAVVLGRQRYITDWAKTATGSQVMLDWPGNIASLSMIHNGKGSPWVTIQSMAALPLQQPLFTGFHITRQLLPVSQQQNGKWHKGDVLRIHLDIESQSDMTWVVLNDPIPAGATILGSGLGGDTQLLTQDEKKQGWVMPAFEERTADSFHAYYRYVPKGRMSVEYTLRLNTDGDFVLPPTRVEAMYAPEIFGALPNAHLVVLP